MANIVHGSDSNFDVVLQCCEHGNWAHILAKLVRSCWALWSQRSVSAHHLVTSSLSHCPVNSLCCFHAQAVDDWKEVRLLNSCCCELFLARTFVEVMYLLPFLFFGLCMVGSS